MFDQYKAKLDEYFSDADEALKKQAYMNVVQDLKKSGIVVEEVSKEDFEELLIDEVKRLKTLGKGALVGAGVFTVLSLLG